MNVSWSQCIVFVILLYFDQSKCGVSRSNASLSSESDNQNVTLLTAPSINNNEEKLRKCEEACKEYQGWSNSRIVVAGGRDAGPFEFPHMVALGFYNPNYNHLQFDCGGSIISPTFVLTAAHCIYNPGEFALKIVRIGAIDVPENTITLDPEFDYEVKRNITHEEYDGKKRTNDIALVELVESIERSPNYQPACLNTNTEVSELLDVAGWGIINFAEKRLTRLQTTPVSVISNKDCAEVILKKLNKTIESSHICAGDEIVNTCWGDSGGPLLANEDSTFYVVGITSFGDKCGTSVPGVYTRVSSFLKWIEDRVWP